MNLVVRTVLIAGIAAIAAGAPSWSIAAETTSTRQLPTEIPIGPADDNRDTSEAISIILERCADAYTQTQAMQATGTFVQASKSDEQTTYVSAKISLDYLRPDKIAVVSKSDSAYLDGAFYADGTTVNHISTANKEYAKLPQPPLDAYAASWRAGEIFTEISGTLSLSGTGSLLIASDPLQWLHEGVVRYVYEGEEESNGRPCHRVRFNQEDPESIVILWIDKESWFVTRVSFISSYDEDYEMVETFEEGSIASMRVMTWDQISTDPSTVKPKAFADHVPKDYKPVTPEADWWDYEIKPGFWESMVGLAAKTSSEETTWSLTRTAGVVDLILEKFAETKLPVEDLDSAIRPAGTESPMALAFKDGTVQVHAYDGTVSSTLRLQKTISMLGWLDTKSSGPLLVATDEKGTAMNAYTPDGKHVWTYQHPYTAIDTFRTPNHSVYVALGDKGLRRLNENGAVEYANSKLANAEVPEVAQPPVDRLVVENSLGVTIADQHLRILESFEADETLAAVRWDDDNKEAPLVTLAVTTDYDVILQRRETKGDILWTTMIEPKSKEYPAATFVWAKLRVGDVIEKCMVILLANGKIAITSANGTIIYRGLIAANDALIAQNDDNIINFAAVADVNGDGADEIYFPLHTHMLRLKTEP